MKKVFVVMNRICDADIVVGVFSTRQKAKAFVKAHKNESCSPTCKVTKYEYLDIEECELDRP